MGGAAPQRVGVLADVHANLAALRAVLDYLDREGVGDVVVAGDLVGYGVEANACVSLLVERGARCVAGNHDLVLTERLVPTHFPDSARRSLDLTVPGLGRDVRAYLEDLTTVRVDPDLVVAHGSLTDPEEYVRGRSRAARELASLPAGGPATLVLGHTHQQAVVTDGGRRAGRAPGRVRLRGRSLVNPGSVGVSREREPRPRARFAVLDLRRGVLDLQAVDYDVGRSVDRLRAAGLPAQLLHEPPPSLPRLRAVAGRVRTSLRSPR